MRIHRPHENTKFVQDPCGRSAERCDTCVFSCGRLLSLVVLDLKLLDLRPEGRRVNSLGVGGVFEDGGSSPVDSAAFTLSDILLYILLAG